MVKLANISFASEHSSEFADSPLRHGHVVYDIEKPDGGGNRDLTPIRFSVHICIYIYIYHSSYYC